MAKDKVSMVGLKVVFLLLVLLYCSGSSLVSGADHKRKPPDAETHFTVRMGSTLWETLIDNGVNPTHWRYVFEYNRTHNPAFKNITSAKRIPRRTIIYIPLEQDTETLRSYGSRGRLFPRGVVQDTVQLLGGIPFLVVKPGRWQQLNSVIKQFCIPPSIRDKRDRMSMIRNIRSDMRYYYRRMDKKLTHKDRLFYIPLHLTADQHEL